MYILMPDDIGYYKYKKQVHELKVGKAMYDWYMEEKRLLNTMRQVVAYSFLRYFELIGLDPWMGEKPPSPPERFPCYVNLLGILPGSNKGVGMGNKPKTLQVIEELLKKEKFLLVWGKYRPGAPGTHTSRDLGRVLINYPKWSVSDCSELVRFWGGLVEEIGKALGKNELGKELNTGQAAEIALRLDDVRKRSRGDSAEFVKREDAGWVRYRRETQQNVTEERAETLKRKEERARHRLKQLREAHKKVPDGGVRDRQYHDERQTPRYLRGYVFPGDHQPAGKDDSHKWIRGCSLLKPVNPSLVKHLDDVFGLWEGADISGTTTDFVGCFEAAWMMVFEGVLAANNEPSKLNAALEVMTWCFPYFALLAPAAMVYGFHHTTYEIGVALSLAYGVEYGDSPKPVFDYHIGFYETLVPNITHVTSGSSGTASKVMAKGRAEEARLRKTLTGAIKSVEKKRKDDNPCLVALIDDKGALYGGFLLSDDERKKHRRFFQSTYVHRMALNIGAHGYSEYLLKIIEPKYKEKLAGRYFKKY